MSIFSNPNISIATKEDVLPLQVLLNKAYRGEESKKGWTTEANLIAGDVRTTEASVLEVLQKAGSVFVKYNQNNELIGCVNLQLQENKLYLGMFSVLPTLQGGGIGKQLLFAAEEYAKSIHCNTIYMTVISVRTELINWYKKYGYAETGETIPFDEDGETGKHLQTLEFLVLEKMLR